MKKSFIIFSLILMTFMISGCGCSKDKKEDIKTVTCKLNEEENSYRIDSTITIKYDSKENEVFSLEENSILTSENEEIRKNFITINDNVYSNYGKYYSSLMNEENAQMKISLDFSEISVDKFIEFDEFNSDFLTDDKIDFEKMLEYYSEFNNYECE